MLFQIRCRSNSIERNTNNENEICVLFKSPTQSNIKIEEKIKKKKGKENSNFTNVQNKSETFFFGFSIPLYPL